MTRMEFDIGSRSLVWCSFVESPKSDHVGHDDFNIFLAYNFHVANSLSLIIGQNFNHGSLKPD